MTQEANVPSVTSESSAGQSESEMTPPHTTEAKGGFWAAMARWWRGEDQPREADLIPSDVSRGEFPNLTPPAPISPPNSAVAEDDSPRSSVMEITGPAEPAMITSPVDKALRRLAHERIAAELEAVQEELEAVKRDTALRIRQLAAEREQSRLEARKEHAEQEEIEARSRPLRKALDTLERRLEEEKMAAAARLRELEAECEQHRVEREDQELRLRELEALVDSSRAAGTPEEWSELQLRARALEAQLDVTKRELVAVKENFENRLRALQAERDDLEQRLASQEQEREALAKQCEQTQDRARQLKELFQESQEQLRRLEAELAERKAQGESQPAAATLSATNEVSESAETPAPAERTAFLPPEVAADFYQQTMSTLTVVLAAADLLAISPRLDPSLRETAREIRTQGQKMVALIKSITYPEKTKEGY